MNDITRRQLEHFGHRTTTTHQIDEWSERLAKIQHLARTMPIPLQGAEHSQARDSQESIDIHSRQMMDQLDALRDSLGSSSSCCGYPTSAECHAGRSACKSADLPPPDAARPDEVK